METIDKYEVLRVLGRGGMGTVYEALDPLINRKVAIKTMIQGLAETPELRERFLREAQAAGGLRHRNIVTVYDLGEDRGQPYIAMEFIEGTDLEKIIQNREPLTLEKKVDVLQQVCDGLGYAHRSGIVHRDIKPANIRLTPEGDVKIMDFGIAHLQSSTMTKSGLVLGTVHYMAPEQIDGHKVDHRADIFSVGAIAYEFISYRKPFEGDSLTAVMFKIMHERPDPGLLPRTAFSPRLERIVMKALARDVQDRYQTLDAMQGDLAQLLQEQGRRSGATPTPRADNPSLPAGNGETIAIVADPLDPRREGTRLVDEGRQRLDRGETSLAVESAQKALALDSSDAGAQALLREAEGEALKRRVAREMSEMRSEMERARAEGQLQKALSLGRRFLDLDPDDAAVSRETSAIQATIQDREVEQLCGLALAYAADGDVELALKITTRIERIDPKNARYLELKRYLGEETARREADVLLIAAKEQLGVGNLLEAYDAAERALVICPNHVAAREIREAASRVLTAQGRTPVPGRPLMDAPLPVAAPAVPPPAPAIEVAVAPLPATASVPSEPEEEFTPVDLAALDVPPEIPASSVPAPAAPNADGAALEKPAPVVSRPLPRPPSPFAARPAPPLPAQKPDPHSAPAAGAATSGSTPSGAVAVSTPPPIPPSTDPPAPSPLPSESPSSPLPEALTPIPEGEPANPEAAQLLESARRLLRDRSLQEALALLERAAALEPSHAGIQRLVARTRIEARRAEIEALTTAALEHFIQNNHGKARKAVEKALALDPQNRKARELSKILGVLG